MRLPRLPILIALAAAGTAGLASAQGKDKAGDAPQIVEQPAPYDDKLARLSEILGTVHYLRNLCDSSGEPEWRIAMQSLLDAETGDEPGRRARMTAAFNRGYRAFAAVHVTCTPVAIAAEQQYRNEGATLATEIAARFGN